MKHTFAEMLTSGEMVQMKTITGATEQCIEAKTDGPTNHKATTVAFIVPEGYVRFGATFTHDHSQGDSAHSDWATGDPRDGSVSLDVNAAGYHAHAKACVRDAFAVKVGSFERLDKIRRAALAASATE